MILIYRVFHFSYSQIKGLKTLVYFFMLLLLYFLAFKKNCFTRRKNRPRLILWNINWLVVECVHTDCIWCFKVSDGALSPNVFISRILTLCISQKWDVIIFYCLYYLCEFLDVLCVKPSVFSSILFLLFLKMPMLLLQFDSVFVLCSLNKRGGC